MLGFIHFPMEASSKLLFPNCDDLQVASMLAADLEFIIILKKKKHEETLSWCGSLRCWCSCILRHEPIEALSKLLFPNYDKFEVASMLAAA